VCTILREEDVTKNRKTVWGRLEAAFALLHCVPALKTLALCFDPISTLFEGPYADPLKVNSHQWDIIAALGSNQNPLPHLQSLTIHQWSGNSPWNFLYDAVPFAQLVKSLRHLSFSMSNLHSYERRIAFWSPVVVRSVLQRTTRLESLAISGSEGLQKEERLDVSELATYPRLASLSLRDILWKDGKIGHQGVVEPPAVEDFIARHRKTLKKLKLHNCVIGISPGEVTPFCYWADVYNRLAKALTELVELEVEFHIDGCRTQYGYHYHYSPYHVALDLGGTEQDGLSLEGFRAVVKNRGTDTDSKPQL
jgi:hypothetical protein